MTWLIMGIVFFTFFILLGVFVLVLLHCYYVKHGGKMYFDEWIKMIWNRLW